MESLVELSHGLYVVLEFATMIAVGRSPVGRSLRAALALIFTRLTFAQLKAACQILFGMAGTSRYCLRT